MIATVISIHSRTDEQVRVAETAGAIIDLALRLRGLIDTLPSGQLRDDCEHAVSGLLIPATEAVHSGDAG